MNHLFVAYLVILSILIHGYVLLQLLSTLSIQPEKRNIIIQSNYNSNEQSICYMPCCVVYSDKWIRIVTVDNYLHL